MTKARTNADNVAGDISGVTAGTGLTGGGTSGTVTLTNDMATTINAAGDLIYGTGNDAYTRLALGTARQTLLTNAGATAPEWAASPQSLMTATGDILYASAANTPARLGIGSNGQYLTISGGIPAWGSAGIEWTERVNATGYTFKTIDYNGSNLWVAAGGNGQLYTSSNGTTWTSRTSGFGSNQINKVHYASSLSIWVAVGDNGTISTSTDGTTWTARTANMSTNLIEDVTSNSTTIVAVGRGGGSLNTGGITYSTDGITWTRKSQTPAIGTDYRTIAWNGTNFVVGSNNSTNNALYASTPSGTWTAVSTAANSDIRVIRWDGTRHLIVSSTELVYHASSTTLASSTVTSSYFPTYIGYYHLYNGEYYVLSNWFSKFTLNSTAYPINQKIFGFAPSTYLNTSSTTTQYGRLPGTLWVGSAGYIITDSDGRIYTSF